MTSQTPFLLTGVTGGLGAKILEDMLNVHKIDPSKIIATSRSDSNRSKYESRGLHFRVADYKDPSTLDSAFKNVKELLFMSSSERDNTTRNREHLNVIEAAKKNGVGRVWYVSLAFGGWTDSSKIGFQQAHYETERLLAQSGLEFVNLRAGIYSDAFPLFLNWYPESERVLFPDVDPPVERGQIAFTTRDELGEGMATLLVKGFGAFPSITPKTEKKIVLLTSQSTDSMVDLVAAIDKARPSKPKLPIEYLSPQDWIATSADGDIGGKGTPWFQARLVFVEGVCKGDAEVIDPALEVLLGRKPETGVQAVERLVREAGGEYRWHQNHINGDWSGLRAGK
ncbi:hypothetical protein M409DRAFT_18900 [Zasmidium cellare ATCC 36951]|uniref:NAD(P)-binding domain-containing protein n=1 Tax=Zasmidium cellare ATCC 36951 TaxID=1080233 RepID=A0A6A6CYP5_ZASCE|nr:uncharacterized protein M409DRAFT_18900 [Zasmidium cellare ATCC 36951]KAF2170929.1 hypothetical protein M409DRAFT_18900 [Zasmidium cellare ATCC 36951]